MRWKMAPRHDTSGFTLVELLVVVLLLGVLSAVALPMLRAQTNEHRSAALVANLNLIRRSIDMYRVQHENRPPDEDFVVQLTGTTNFDGSPGTKYGPYVRNGIPCNPFNGLDTVAIVETLPAFASGDYGWFYVTSTGEFRANVPGHGASGVKFLDL